MLDAVCLRSLAAWADVTEAAVARRLRSDTEWAELMRMTGMGGAGGGTTTMEMVLLLSWAGSDC